MARGARVVSADEEGADVTVPIVVAGGIVLMSATVDGQDGPPDTDGNARSAHPTNAPAAATNRPSRITIRMAN
jgi:hypothetical protein